MMEPWQYSALQTQFSSLLQTLSCNSQNSRPNHSVNGNSANNQAMNMDSCDDKAHCRAGIKRKLSDSDDQDNLWYKKMTLKQPISENTKLKLDVYTQTNASYVGDQTSTLAKIAELVKDNARRLDGIENLLMRVERNISLLGSDSINIDKDSRKPALTVEIKPTSSLEPIRTPATPSTPASFISDMESNENILGPTVNVLKSPMTTTGHPLVQLQGIPITAQSIPTNGLSQSPTAQQSGIQGMESFTKAANQESRTEAQTKGLDMNDEAPNVLVPVIFASEDKSRRCTTAEVALHDLLNGNVSNPEDRIQIFRGCWLGDRLDPHSRIWYYGDFKVIQRAEASGSNPAKLSLNLLEALFTREEMASSNVNGARGRDLLDPIKIKAIYAHINFKFPTDSDKQELRWHFLKPRIDSKCRAQRRIQRDHEAVGDTPHQSIKERPFRSKLIKPLLDPKIKEELLYGLAKPDGASSSAQVASEVINGTRANEDSGNSELNTQTGVNGQTSVVYGSNTL